MQHSVKVSMTKCFEIEVYIQNQFSFRGAKAGFVYTYFDRYTRNKVRLDIVTKATGILYLLLFYTLKWGVMVTGLVIVHRFYYRHFCNVNKNVYIHKNKNMKKILLLIFTLGTAFFGTAQQGSLVISANGLKKLQLGENMKVTLVGSEKHQEDMKGTTALFEKLNISVHNGTMKIEGRNNLFKNDTVTVIVDALESLTLGQNTQVNTKGTLHGTDLNVFLDAGAVAQLLTTGKVKGFSLDTENVTVNVEPIRVKMTLKAM